MTSRSDLTRAEYDALKNTPELMLKRGGRLLQVKTNQIIRLSRGEREYLEQFVARRARATDAAA